MDVLLQFWIACGAVLVFETVQSSIWEDSYQFRYSIDKDGVTVQQEELRRVDHTKGSYSVLQPDGKIRDVRYEVNGNGGYNAIVDYRPKGSKVIGHLKYPQDFRHPVINTEPVAIISRELLNHYHSKKHVSKHF